MDDLDVLALQCFVILGAFCLGVIMGSHDARGLPPPDPKSQRCRNSPL